MVFEGDLKTLSLPQVLQLLSSGKHTGTLHVQTGRLVHLIYLEEGQIALYVPGLRVPLDIGSSLCKSGHLSRTLVSFVARKAESTGRSLGNHLVATGAAPVDVVTEAVYNTVKEQLFELLLTKVGQYEFKPGEYPSEDIDPQHIEFPYRMNPEELMIENLRRQSEWKNFESLLPNAEIVLERHEHDKEEWNKLDVPSGHARELALVDGRRSIAEIMEETTLSSFELYRVLCAALGKEYVSLPRKHRMAELGDEAAKQGDAVASIKFFRNALMRDQFDHLIRLRFARHLIELGLNGDAFEQLILLGDQFENLGEKDFAETFYREALEVLPDHPEALKRLEGIEGRSTRNEDLEDFTAPETSKEDSLNESGSGSEPSGKEEASQDEASTDEDEKLMKDEEETKSEEPSEDTKEEVEPVRETTDSGSEEPE